MDTAELVQRLREQRLTTLALADQVSEERWREPVLPGGSLHDILAHLLGWDEWAMAVFDISAARALPEVLVDALKAVDGYNARSQKRYAKLSREDLLSGLQAITPRLLASATNRNAPRWDERRIAELGEIWAQLTSSPHGPRAPSVKGLLRMLYEHEKDHDEEIGQGFGISADLDRFKPQAEAGDAPDDA
jgi:uncharacterized protein (TIGR03083 family)